MPEERRPEREADVEDAEERQVEFDIVHRRLLWMLVLMNVLCGLLFIWKEILH